MNNFSVTGYICKDAEVKNFDKAAVLILVLMEDTLREQNLRILKFRGFDNSKTYKIGFC